MKKKISILVLILVLILSLAGCQEQQTTIPEGLVVDTTSGYYLDDYTYVNLDNGNAKLNVVYYGDPKVKRSYKLNCTQSEFSEPGYYQVEVKVMKGNDVVDTLRTIVVADYSDNAEFAEYESEMFVYFMEGDQCAANIFMEDYTKFGLEHSDAIYYTYERYNQEDFDHDVQEVADLRAEYNTFASKKLSLAQLESLSVIDKNIRTYEFLLADESRILMRQSYVDQFGGYVADFPTNMEAYTVRTVEDIEDIISYFNSTYDAFMSYFDYIEDRAAIGYGFSEFTLTTFNEYLQGVIDKGNDYYLYPIMEKKIKDAQEKLNLSDTQVSEYCDQLYTAFTEKFIQVHTDLKAAIVSFIATAKATGGYLNKNTKPKFREGYLQKYDGGVTVYENMLRERLGMYDMSIDNYILYLDDKIETYKALYFALNSSASKTAKSINNGKKAIVTLEDPTQTASVYDIMDYLKEFAKTIVPELKSEPNIDITYMDETATENTTTVAYYMKSALDSRENEYIHLNEKALGNSTLETINTLAHEGYPGHLYEYVSTKENENLSNLVRVNTCTGHGEGWAKYVEIALDKYIAEQHKDDSNYQDWVDGMNLTTYWDVFVYSLYARLDVGINYQGWGVNEVAALMSKCSLNSSAAEDLFRTLIECPSQYAPYGYGMDVFLDFHIKAQTELGDLYNEVEFNAAIQAHGWVGLDDTQHYADEYISNVKFLNFID